MNILTDLVYWLRWGRPRRLLLWITLRLPPDSWLREKLGEFLIPRDCIIRFPD